MEALIEFLSEQLTIKPSDLLMNDDDRMIMVGQIDLLEQIKDIHKNGYPTNEED
jgi:hypothetical protein